MGSNCDLFFRETVAELTRIIQENVVGLAPGRAEEIAQEWGRHMRREMRGQKVYVPKREELSDRDLQIWRAFNGENRRELCQKYDISEVWLYRIVKAVNARVNKKLPFEESENG